MSTVQFIPAVDCTQLSPAVMVHVSDSNVARHFQLPLLVHGAICLSVHSISLQSTSEVYRMHFSFHEFCTAPVQWLLITQANSNRVDRNLCGICVYLFVCLFVCLFVFHTISQKPKQLGSPDYIEMFHHESWKLSYFGVERLKYKVTRHKKR